LIFEYVSGGGYINRRISASILSEGYGMIRGLISDYKVAGHNITTLMDSRLKKYNPPNQADQIVIVSSPHELSAKLKELSNLVDAVYFIAPESGQVLKNLMEHIESFGCASLNCEIGAIKCVSNKMKMYEMLKKRGFKVPETVLVDTHKKIEDIKILTRDLGYPLVFKPLDGVSCGGLSLVRNDANIAEAIKKIEKESMNKQFIAQKMIRGKATSACVISTGEKAVAVTLNRQLVTLALPNEQSSYYGGMVPFDHNLEKEALKTAERAVEGIGGLKGYVGVDMILTKEGAMVLEINPRLTTSYLGLRRVINFNPAEAIVDAIIGKKLPKRVYSKGYSFFSKVEVHPRPQIIDETYKMEDVISPPFPIEENKSAYALITSISTSAKGAESAFYRTRNRLLNLYQGD
jgi:predicted ATP-grasp superfamily ATP-dependent carboligase